MTNCLLKALLLSFVIWQVRTQEAECKQLIETWLRHPENVPMEAYTNSGKFLNDLGDYNNCEYFEEQYTYFTMKVLNKLVGYQYMGLCAPNKCRAVIHSNKYSKDVEDQLNQMYQNKTGDSTGVFYNMQFFEPEEAAPHFDWSNYLVVALIGLIVLLGVLGSVLPRVTQRRSLPIEILKTFSLFDNLAKIVSIPSSVENENLLFLNGARVLSIFWIVFGHDMWFRLMNNKNWMETVEILQTPGITTLAQAGYFAVDTFFWIGGFLICIGMLPQIKKTRSFLKFYVGSVLHRFIRIWPTYMMAILIFWKIAPYLGSGPIWSGYAAMASSCNDGGILWNMFFLDNFADHGPSGMDYCFGWGWYLAVDFQLFLITPFVILAYHRNKRLGWTISFLLFLASIVCAFVLIVVNEWRYPIPNPKLKPQPKFMDQFYFRPYIRASTYFMGIFSGFIYHEWKNHDPLTMKIVNKIKGSIPLRVLLYVVGISLCELVLWIVVPYQRGGYWSTTTQAFYNSLNRVFFILGMYCCVFAAMFGCKNDPSHYILGHWLFSPLAKVSFCIYLMHLVVIVGGTFSGKMDLYWTSFTATFISISDILWATLAATGLSLLIQAPILGLEKILLKGGKKKDRAKDTANVEFSETIEKQSNPRHSLLVEGSSDSSSRESQFPI